MQIAPVDVARHARYRAFRARLYIDAGYAIGAATLSWVAWQPVGVDDLRCHGKASHGRRNGKNRQRQRKIPVRKKKNKKNLAPFRILAFSKTTNFAFENVRFRAGGGPPTWPAELARLRSNR
jgi:hypothetical protein